MSENAMRGQTESTRAVAERGRAALELLRRATHCEGCKKAKPSHMRGWGASSGIGMRTYHVLCEVCSRRRPTLSPRPQQMAAQLRRLDDAERELAAMWPSRR
jgi:hypothetical protein